MYFPVFSRNMTKYGVQKLSTWTFLRRVNIAICSNSKFDTTMLHFFRYCFFYDHYLHLFAIRNAEERV